MTHTGRLGTAAGRWIVAASVLGSGAVFLESTVVNVALPAIAHEFHLGVEGLQWILNGYLLTLSALMLLGGGLGDRFPRSTVFAVGCLGFAAASVGCALAPSVAWLVVMRLVQGVAGALLVPNSLAMLETAFEGAERGTAIGRWSAWSGISTAAGPLLGGWLVDTVSWRWVFASVVVFAVVAAWVAWRHGPTMDATPGSKPSRPTGRVDYLGAALVTLGLAGVITALVIAPDQGFGRPIVLALGLGGAALLGIFIAVERGAEHRGVHPLLPLSAFRSRQFTGANLTTLLVYSALGGLFFLLMPQLQGNLGYTALQAGASLLPVNVLLLVLSPVAGRVSARIGPRIPLAVGSLTAGLGMLLFARIGPGASYVGTVFPAAVVFGLGLSALVAPLTAAALGALEGQLAGVASGINNAVARLAGLVATAALPLAAGLGGGHRLVGAAYVAGYMRAMWISAGLCAAGAAVALTTVRGGRAPRPAR